LALAAPRLLLAGTHTPGNLALRLPLPAGNRQDAQGAAWPPLLF
jgi:hypothetical protein